MAYRVDCASAYWAAGCSGLSYLFKFDVKPRPTDQVFDFDDVKVFVDPKSMVYLDGMTLDWKDSLIHSGFEFDNPHAKKSCGCGRLFRRDTSRGVFGVIRRAGFSA